MASYNDVLIHTGKQVSTYLKSWQDSFKDDKSGGCCETQCGYFFLNPFLSGIGISAYHGAKGLMRLLEFAAQVTKLFFLTLALVGTCGNVERIGEEWCKTIKATWFTFEANIRFLSQGILHVSGTVAAVFSPNIGLAMVKAAVDMDVAAEERKKAFFESTSSS